MWIWLSRLEMLFLRVTWHKMLEGTDWTTLLQVQFEVDFQSLDGSGMLVKVDGEIISNITDGKNVTNVSRSRGWVHKLMIQTSNNFFSVVETTVNEVSFTYANGTYQTTFPSSQSISISATTFLLSMQFTGDTGTMQNQTKGLLG